MQRSQNILIKTMKPVLILINIKLIIVLTTTSELVDKAVSIANEAYEPDLLTIVAWWNDDHEYINKFLLKYLGAVATIKLQQPHEGNKKTFKFQQAVVFASNPAEFDDFFSLASNVTLEAILVILVIVDESSAVDLIDYSKIALQRCVQDIAIVSLKFDGTVLVSSINPYGSSVCGDYTPREVTIPQSIIFKENKYNNLHGCPVRVSIFEFLPYVQLIKENNQVVTVAGIDGNFANLIITTLNATMTIVSDDGEPGEYVDGEPQGYFRDLFYDRTDMVLPPLIMNIKRYPALFSPIYRPSRVVICLRNRSQIYKFARVFLPFCSWSTSIVIAAAIIIYSTLRFIKRLGQRDYVLPQRTQFAIFSIFIGQYSNVKSRFWLINTLFILWIWFSFVYRIFYSGILIKGLHHVILEPKAKTIKDAKDVVNEIYIHRPIMEYLRNSPLEENADIIKATDIKNVLFAIASGEKILLATEISVVNFYKKKVQILKHRAIYAPASIFMRPRWPVSKYISNIILRSVETGHINKIIRDSGISFAVRSLKRPDELSYKPLGLNILGFCFIGLILMYIVCSIILVVEIYYNYYNRRRNMAIPFLH